MPSLVSIRDRSSSNLALDGLSTVYLAEADGEVPVPDVPIEVQRYEFNTSYYSQPQGNSQSFHPSKGARTLNLLRLRLVQADVNA